MQQWDKQDKGGVNLIVLDQRYRSQIEGFLKEAFTMDHFHSLLEAINSDCILRQHWGMIGIRKLITMEEGKNVEIFVRAGVPIKLMEFARNEEYLQIKHQALHALVNVAAGSHSQCSAVVQAGGIPLFIKLLAGSNKQINLCAAEALTNIAADCAEYRDAIIAQGGIICLINYLDLHNDGKYFSHGCRALSYLCKTSPLPKYKHISKAIPVICKIIANEKLEDKDIIASCCWAISFFCQEFLLRKIARQTGLIPILVKLLQQNQAELLMASIIIIRKFVSTESYHQIQELFAMNILSSLKKHINHSNKHVRHQAYRLLANLAIFKHKQFFDFSQYRQILFIAVERFQYEQVAVRYPIIQCLSNLVLSNSSSQLFDLICSSKIIYNITSFFFHQNYKLSLKDLCNCLVNFYSILVFCRNNSQDNQDSILLEFKQGGGNQLLEILNVLQQEEIMNAACLIKSTF